jgi:hypothetical protein
MMDPHPEFAVNDTIRRGARERGCIDGLMVAATNAVSPALAVGPQWVGLSQPNEAGLMTALLMRGVDAGMGPTGSKTGARFISPT